MTHSILPFQQISISNFKSIEIHSDLGKKSALHIAEQCLSIFGVSVMFPHDSVYTESFNSIILQLAASGLNLKIKNDMAWDLQRSDTNALLKSAKSKKFSFADVEERKLNLADTEGMFLLMAVGYTVGKYRGYYEQMHVRDNFHNFLKNPIYPDSSCSRNVPPIFAFFLFYSICRYVQQFF